MSHGRALAGSLVPWARDKAATVADGATDAAGSAGAAGAAGNAGASGAAGAAVRPWAAIWLRITLIGAIFRGFWADRGLC